MSPIQGELQAQIMPAVWRIGEGSVEQVRSALPKRYRSAYTTVQTVLNRLAERGLLVRERRGNTIYYRPRISEADYLSRTIQQTLAGASAEARQLPWRSCSAASLLPSATSSKRWRSRSPAAAGVDDARRGCRGGGRHRPAAPLAAVPLAIDLTAALTGVADPGDASLLAAAPVVHCPA